MQLLNIFIIKFFKFIFNALFFKKLRLFWIVFPAIVAFYLFLEKFQVFISFFQLMSNFYIVMHISCWWKNSLKTVFFSILACVSRNLILMKNNCRYFCCLTLRFWSVTVSNVRCRLIFFFFKDMDFFMYFQELIFIK